MLLVLKEALIYNFLLVLKGGLLLKVLPGRAGGKSSDHKVLNKHKVLQVLKERQVHKEQKMIQVLTEIQELREHKVRAGGPAAATGGDGSTIRCNSSSRCYRFPKRHWSTRCCW